MMKEKAIAFWEAHRDWAQVAMPLVVIEGLFAAVLLAGGVGLKGTFVVVGSSTACLLLLAFGWAALETVRMNVRSAWEARRNAPEKMRDELLRGMADATQLMLEQMDASVQSSLNRMEESMGLAGDRVQESAQQALEVAKRANESAEDVTRASWQAVSAAMRTANVAKEAAELLSTTVESQPSVSGRTAVAQLPEAASGERTVAPQKEASFEESMRSLCSLLEDVGASPIVDGSFVAFVSESKESGRKHLKFFLDDSGCEASLTCVFDYLSPLELRSRMLELVNDLNLKYKWFQFWAAGEDRLTVGMTCYFEWEGVLEDDEVNKQLTRLFSVASDVYPQLMHAMWAE